MMYEIVLAAIIRVRCWFTEPLRTFLAVLPHVSQFTLASAFIEVPVLRKYLVFEKSFKAQNQLGLSCSLWIPAGTKMLMG